MEELDLKKFFNTVWQKKWIVLSIIILFTIVGTVYTYFMVTPKYKSSVQIVLTTVDSSTKTTEDSITQTDVNLNKNLVDTYSKIIKSDRVLKLVLEGLNLQDKYTEDNLRSMISVSTENTALAFTISVVNANAELARDIANKVGITFAEQNEEFFHINNVKILDEAKLETSPYNIHHLKDIAIFFALGVFVSLGIMLLVYMLDTTIKGPEDIEYLKMQVSGVIPMYSASNEEKMAKDSLKNKEKSVELIVLNNSKSPNTEAFRTLRTNIIYSREDKPVKTILITSCNAQEGKSYVSSNLACMFARTNRRVIIVDADMRKGRQNKIFKVANGTGLSNCLRDMGSRGRLDVQELGKYIKETKIPNLHIMTAGDRPSNSAELLSATRVVKLVELLESVYDMVIFDGTPSAIVSDSVAMSKFVDLVYIVSAYKHTKMETLNNVKKSIEAVGTKVTGVILNKYELSKTTYTYNYYYDNNRHSNLDEGGDQIKSVQDVIDEAVKKNKGKDVKKKFEFMDVGPESNLDSGVQNPNIVSDRPIDNNQINNMPAVTATNQLSSDLVNIKLENMSNEISVIKNMFVQMMMNEDKVTQEDIRDLKSELSQMKETIENAQVNTEVRDMRDELESLKEMTEQLAVMQKNNNEKVKMFLDNYKKKKEQSDIKADKEGKK